MIEVSDLIGRPYEPLLCIGYARLALLRAHPDMRETELPTTPDEGRDWLKLPDGHWMAVGTTVFDAKVEGDLVYGSSDGVREYVAVLADEKGGGFLTADPERGCHIRPRRLLRGVRLVVRRQVS